MPRHGRPRARPQVAGANLGNVIYLRTLRDVLALREMMELERDIVIVGGGFLAAEAASVLLDRAENTSYTCCIVESICGTECSTPRSAEFLTGQFAARGVKMMLGETLNGFEGRTVLKNVQTKSGQRFSADMAVVAIGCELNTGLVQNTPLAYPHGTPVNEYLETDEKGIYAVGDIAAFPCKILGGVRRFEHWECAHAQGYIAGQNMSGKKRIKFEHIARCAAQALDMHFDFVGDFSKPPTRYVLDGDRNKKKFVARYFQPNGLMGILLCNQSAEKVAAAKEELRTAPRGKKEVVV